MNRRDLISGAMGAALASSLAGRALAVSNRFSLGEMGIGGSRPAPQSRSLALDRHRFGVNYTPSKNWWFCWNEWDAGSMKRDLDGIAALGADHLRILLLWPYFQPNPKWVSPLHLERMDQLLTMMGERGLDAVVTVFTGQLSGWFFLPPFNKAGSGFYADEKIWNAQEILIRQLAGVMKQKNNVIGFDFGNEINTCWA
ncbi:MAG: hypothetical protein WCA99_14880, partial [Candidatus Sulfotelmatobacter sp.]